MRKINLISVVLIALLVQQIEGHPGPEPHPTVAELDAVEEALQAEIKALQAEIKAFTASLGNIERRLDEVESSIDARTEGSVPEISQPNDEEADQVKSIEINEWVQYIALGLVTLVGGFSWIKSINVSRRLKSLQNKCVNNSSGAPGKEENQADPAKDEKNEVEEESTEASNTRIVTHTRKDENRKTITELHNLHADWSPRTVPEAITDIEAKEFSYISRGPHGNEAKIVVRKSTKGNLYLTTEPDAHETNNLLNLPDPPRSE